MNDTMIKAIETVYSGRRFRSRLEARWAVFFDALGIEYEYEKEGYDLGAGGRYLPDFWLPAQDCWIEIKPDASYLIGGQYIQGALLAQGTRKDLYVMEGGQFVPFRWGSSIHDFTGTGARWFPPYEYEDDPREWVRRGGEHQYKPWIICASFDECCCGFVAPGMAHIWEAHMDRTGHYRSHEFLGESHRLPEVSSYTVRLLAAYDAARQARFER